MRVAGPHSLQGSARPRHSAPRGPSLLAALRGKHRKVMTRLSVPRRSPWRPLPSPNHRPIHPVPPQQREGHFDTPPSRPAAQRAWSRPGCLLARRSERCPLNHAQCESGECCDSGSGEQRLFTCAAVDRYASAASPEGSAASLGSGPCMGHRAQRMQRPSTIPPTVQCGGGAHAPRLGPRGGSLGMASMNSCTCLHGRGDLEG